MKFEGETVMDVVISRIKHGETPGAIQDCPSDYGSLTTTCWAANPNERPSFDGARECAMIVTTPSNLYHVFTDISRSLAQITANSSRQRVDVFPEHGEDDPTTGESRRTGGPEWAWGKPKTLVVSPIRYYIIPVPGNKTCT